MDNNKISIDKKELLMLIKKLNKNLNKKQILLKELEEIIKLPIRKG